MTNRLDPATFDSVAVSECRRWQPRTLQVARQLLVGGEPPSLVAANASMSIQQTVVVRLRFLEKVKQARLRQFMANTLPEMPPDTIPLEPHKSEIFTLRGRGYTDEQIAVYLNGIGVSTSAEKIRDFLSQHRGIL